MSTPSIPSRLLDALQADVGHHGILGVETGMFLLGHREGQCVDTLALAGTAGVRRRRDRFSLSGKALAKLFGYAREHELQVLAQVHSHGAGAFLSPSDLQHGFAVEGFTTAVVPTYRRPPRDPRAWGWWRYDGHGWATAAPYTSCDAPGAAHTIVFDQEGVRAR